MKRLVRLGLCMMLFACVITGAYAQDVAAEEGTYVKKNIALTKFKILGVNSKQYAKCMESQNFLEADKRLSYTVIDKIEYADDGEGYDRTANDGVMTSKTLFSYSEGQRVVVTGQYVPAKEDFIVYDRQFAHTQGVNSGTGKVKLSFSCDIFWQNCNTWPPQYQSTCRRLTWPFSGYIVIQNCGFEITVE